MDKYIQRRLEDIKMIKEEISKGSYEYAQVVGHRLKGHGNTFGYLEISLIGESLEKALKNKDTKTADDLILQLETLILSHS